MTTPSISQYPDSAPTPLPRGLILLACLWISGSWLENIGIRTPIQPVAQEYTFSLQMLCCSLMIGIVVGWTLMRLSVTRFVRPIRQSLLDIGVVTSGILVTIWPLRLLSTWSVEQTVLLSALLFGWTWLVGGVVCLGASSRSGLLRAALILSAFVLVGLEVVLPESGRLSWWRPLDLVLRFTEANRSGVAGGSPEGAGVAVAQLLLAGSGLWLLVIGWRGLARDSGGRRPE